MGKDAKKSKFSDAARKALGSKPKVKVSASSSAIAKRKHAHGEGSGKKDSERKHKLVQKLQQGAQPPRETAREKKRRKQSAQSAVLGAVSGMQQSLEDLMRESEQRVRAAQPTPPEQGGVSLTSKKRQQLVVEETQHMRDVLAHPAFVADPFAALQEHLANTVAPNEKDLVREKKRRPDKPGHKSK